MGNNESFCNENMAMSMGMSGYTFGPKPEDGCFVFLYKDYVINTQAKYAGLIIAMLVIGILSELMREAKVVYYEHWFFKSDEWSSAYLAVQMGISYTLMLLVMLFDFGVVVAACCGLGFGHWLGRKWRKAVESRRGSGGGGIRELPSSAVYEGDNETAPLVKNPSFERLDSLHPTLQDSGKTPQTPDTTPCCRV